MNVRGLIAAAFARSWTSSFRFRWALTQAGRSHSRVLSFGTLLKANGEDVKTVQELLRYANSRITLDVYTQAVNSNSELHRARL